MNDIQQLVRHLRENPKELQSEPAALAARFGVPDNLVRDVQKWVRGAAQQTAVTPVIRAKPAPKPPKRALFAEVLRHDFWVIVGSSAALILFRKLADAFTTRTDSGHPIWWVANLVSIIVWLLQLFLIFRKGEFKLLLSTMGINLVFWGLLSTIQINPGVEIHLENGIPVFFVVFLFGVFGVPASVLGSVRNYQTERNRIANLTRQQMLERLFEVRDRLTVAQGAEQPEAASSELRRTAHQHIYLITGVTMFLLSLAFYAIFGFLDPEGQILQPKSTLTQRDSVLMLYALSFSAGSSIMALLFGFWSGGPIRAMLASVVGNAASVLAMLVPIGNSYSKKFVKFSDSNVLFGILFTFGMFVLGGVVALVNDQANRTRRLKENEPSALVAEMLELEWKLRPQSQQVCVLVVDAAKSSEMKAQADPFEAEWSFREYQGWIDRICSHHLGSVHSTAGDGAVIGFPNCALALEAAQELQNLVEEFNQKVNRLQSPFRLRVGLHVGELHGALDQVEFTEVIDIAAHVEGAAEIGGIAVSERVQEQLPGVNFIKTDRIVDGYTVYRLPKAGGFEL